MPFTLSHPVVILPVAHYQRFLPLSALVIGSMAPDFPYFLMIHSNYYHVGHSTRGIFTFCLPAGLIVLAIYHLLIKMPLLALLPFEQSSRLYPIAKSFRPRRFMEYLGIVLGLIVGAASHIALDSLTHVNGWSVRHLPFLAHPFPIYKILQYGGSVLGLWILYIAYRRWLKESPSYGGTLRFIQPGFTQRQVAQLLAGITVLSCVFGAAYSAKEFRMLHGHERRKKIFADALESGMMAAFVGTCFYSLAWHVAHYRIDINDKTNNAQTSD